MTVTAEGVETRGRLAILRRLRCELVRGCPSPSPSARPPVSEADPRGRRKPVNVEEHPGVVRDETEAERLDRHHDELLQGLRVVLPGVQVINAFLLTVPFTQRFARTTALQRNVFFATLLLTAAATVLLMAATAAHRALFRQGRKDLVVEIGHRCTIAGMTLLAFAFAGSLFVVTDLLFSDGFAVLVAALTLLLAAAVWAGLPLVLRRRTPRP